VGIDIAKRHFICTAIPNKQTKLWGENKCFEVNVYPTSFIFSFVEQTKNKKINNIFAPYTILMTQLLGYAVGNNSV